jgi:hypothetical protein
MDDRIIGYTGEELTSLIGPACHGLKPAKGLRLRLRLDRRTVVAATLFTLFDRAHALSSFLLLQLACLCT